MDQIAALLDRHVADGDIAGAVALVEHDGERRTVTSGRQGLPASPPMRPDTIFRIASMTKPILAAAALILVEEGRIGLQSSVEPWLPELAGRRVLRHLAAPLDDTEPARRPITLDDLLTLRPGFGAIMPPADGLPIRAALQALGLEAGPELLSFGPDEFMHRLGQLPLLAQPGERWLYHTGFEVLSVLIARLCGRPLAQVLDERLFAPLGMTDTGFCVPPGQRDRLAEAFARDEQGRLAAWQGDRAGAYLDPPAFPSELVSTAGDYARFAAMLAAGGTAVAGANGPVRILGEASVDAMMRDQLTAGQKQRSPFMPQFWDYNGWGYGGSVTTRATQAAALGSYGWMGGFGTSVLIDRARRLVVILLLQRVIRDPADTWLNIAVQSLAYAGAS